ncbi:hypothetical protein BDQ12DRAFT_670965 [Crucibulum laeve]|uniref:Uncharacterized protein n=1 Tax=Crucibulum laeve TaxID=68775 RepID=A0A5C3LHG9_9AGAR|nr:hypothetical protein BDQ12DRAFT_670965 [Crucibulum laeve]
MINALVAEVLLTTPKCMLLGVQRTSVTFLESLVTNSAWETATYVVSNMSRKQNFATILENLANYQLSKIIVRTATNTRGFQGIESILLRTPDARWIPTIFLESPELVPTTAARVTVVCSMDSNLDIRSTCITILENLVIAPTSTAPATVTRNREYVGNYNSDHGQNFGVRDLYCVKHTDHIL